MTDIGDISGIGANALRELAAPLKMFWTPAGALLWLVDQKANRDAHGLNMDGGGGPRSQEGIDTANRTFGVLASCVVAKHKYDDPNDPSIHDPDSAFGMLADWCREKGYKETKLAHAAQRHDMNVETYNRWMRGLLRLWARRVRGCGLIEKRLRYTDQFCECGCGAEQLEEVD